MSSTSTWALQRELNDRFAVKENKMKREIGTPSQADLIGAAVLFGILLGMALVVHALAEEQKKTLRLRENSEDDDEECRRKTREEEEEREAQWLRDYND